MQGRRGAEMVWRDGSLDGPAEQFTLYGSMGTPPMSFHGFPLLPGSVRNGARRLDSGDDFGI